MTINEHHWSHSPHHHHHHHHHSHHNLHTPPTPPLSSNGSSSIIMESLDSTCCSSASSSSSSSSNGLQNSFDPTRTTTPTAVGGGVGVRTNSPPSDNSIGTAAIGIGSGQINSITSLSSTTSSTSSSSSSSTATNNNNTLFLERKPYKPFKSNEEYLIAMKEDLAEWLNTLYGLDLNCENFLQRLETGVILCQHANSVLRKAREWKLLNSPTTSSNTNNGTAATSSLSSLSSLTSLSNVGGATVGVGGFEDSSSSSLSSASLTSLFVDNSSSPLHTNGGIVGQQQHKKEFSVPVKLNALPGTFQSRDNVANFIEWCRKIQIHECLLFETEDLVSRKNEKSFVLCLLEVARYGAKFGVLAPTLVQFEQEIDKEIENDNKKLRSNDQRINGLNYDDSGGGGGNSHDHDNNVEIVVDDDDIGPQQQITNNDLESLHEKVVNLLSRCKCRVQFYLEHLSEGKYRIGDTKTLIFVRILRNHVMVRVGGGWDTLEHYLEKHDPCRCRFGHRYTSGARISLPNSQIQHQQQQQQPHYYQQSPQQRSAAAVVNATGQPSTVQVVVDRPGEQLSNSCRRSSVQSPRPLSHHHQQHQNHELNQHHRRSSTSSNDSQNTSNSSSGCCSSTGREGGSGGADSSLSSTASTLLACSNGEIFHQDDDGLQSPPPPSSSSALGNNFHHQQHQQQQQQLPVVLHPDRNNNIKGLTQQHSQQSKQQQHHNGATPTATPTTGTNKLYRKRGESATPSSSSLSRIPKSISNLGGMKLNSHHHNNLHHHQPQQSSSSSQLTQAHKLKSTSFCSLMTPSGGGGSLGGATPTLGPTRIPSFDHRKFSLSGTGGTGGGNGRNNSHGLTPIQKSSKKQGRYSSQNSIFLDHQNSQQQPQQQQQQQQQSCDRKSMNFSNRLQQQSNAHNRYKQKLTKSTMDLMSTGRSSSTGRGVSSSGRGCGDDHSFYSIQVPIVGTNKTTTSSSPGQQNRCLNNGRRNGAGGGNIGINGNNGNNNSLPRTKSTTLVSSSASTLTLTTPLSSTLSSSNSHHHLAFTPTTRDNNNKKRIITNNNNNTMNSMIKQQQQQQYPSGIVGVTLSHHHHHHHHGGIGTSKHRLQGSATSLNSAGSTEGTTTDGGTTTGSSNGSLNEPSPLTPTPSSPSPSPIVAAVANHQMVMTPKTAPSSVVKPSSEIAMMSPMNRRQTQPASPTATMTTPTGPALVEVCSWSERNSS